MKNLELIGKHVDVNAFKERLDVNVNVTIADRIAAAGSDSKNVRMVISDRYSVIS